MVTHTGDEQFPNERSVGGHLGKNRDLLLGSISHSDT